MSANDPESSALAATYDAFPYVSRSFPNCRPDHLATLAKLFGIEAAPAERARVLEVGCASGNNIIPLAEQYPHAEFVGIDLSKRQIEEGRAVAAPLALENLRLQQGDIVQLGEDLGTFDYIIAWGVFSWVPAQVQSGLLALCARSLRPQGVALVTYNTYPGWHARGVLRDVMLFAARELSDPLQRLRAAMSALDFVAQSVPPQSPGYRGILKEEIESVRSAAPYYLLHDHMELHNHAIHFADFVHRAQSVELQYLGDADPVMMSTDHLPKHFNQHISQFTSDPIAIEQYLDFATNRTYRQSLLCRRGLPVNHRPPVSTFQEIRVASRGKRVEPKASAPTGSVAFRWPRSTMDTTDQLFIEAYSLLARIWPESIAVADLIERIGPHHAPTPGSSMHRLLMHGLYSGQLEFSMVPDGYISRISPRPVAATSARLAAQRGPLVTNRRHESVRLDEIHRSLIQLLDGTRDRDAIVHELLQMAQAGKLLLRKADNTVVGPAGIRSAIREAIDPLTARLAELMLLIA